MLPENHPLANLDDGFKIKEAVNPVDAEQAGVSDELMDSFNAMFPGVLLDNALPSQGPGPRPLRQVIPRTEGRAVGWKLVEHLNSARARNWPGVKPYEFDGQSIAICGGGPSLGLTLHELRDLQRSGTRIMAINRTQDYLLNLPNTHKQPWIKPWAGVLLEALPNAASYIKPRGGIRYYVASQCAPQTFDTFQKFDHYIWHAISKPEFNDALTRDERTLAIPPNGSTCGLRAILLAYTLGFREIHLFGMDSSYDTRAIENGIFGHTGAPRLHSYDKPETIHDFKVLTMQEVDPSGKPTGRTKDYYGNGNMIAQADEFQSFMEWRNSMLLMNNLEPHRLIVHGTGAIPDIAAFYGVHADQSRNVKHSAEYYENSSQQKEPQDGRLHAQL